jgi:lipopolysaccharide export LptBFGC system permease protein LptF
MPTEQNPELDTGNRKPPRKAHTRRPPLAEIDSWELWQAWQRGERDRVTPWLRLLAGFSILLAAMYSFFFVSSVLSDDTIAPIVLVFVYLCFMYWIWQRISPRRKFALAVVCGMIAVSLAAFAIWFLIYWLSGWVIWVGIFGTIAVGMVGLLVTLPGLNMMAKESQSATSIPPQDSPH